MRDDSERLARLARAWSEAASGYEDYFVPRFAPWVELAVAAVTEHEVPEGPVLVPCCGTFPELDLLAAGLPGREVVGIDLSEGMVALARERAAGNPLADAVVGDAQTLDPRWSGRCGAVVSVFGLQQIPDPVAAVGSWLDALRPGGRLSIVFWPRATESDGPFALIAELLRERFPAREGDSAWEDDLAAAVTGRGATLERDELVAFPMVHASAAAYFDASAASGPLRALAISQGEDFMRDLRAEFAGRAPEGEWRHRPHARLITARR